VSIAFFTVRHTKVVMSDITNVKVFACRGEADKLKPDNNESARMESIEDDNVTGVGRQPRTAFR
jgi:hypothetical protein